MTRKSNGNISSKDKVKQFDSGTAKKSIDRSVEHHISQ